MFILKLSSIVRAQKTHLETTNKKCTEKWQFLKFFLKLMSEMISESYDKLQFIVIFNNLH